MSKTQRVAKLFKNGASQAVRLPAAFRFEGDQVYATRDERTGDVLLSTRPSGPTLGDLMRSLQDVEGAEEFMSDRPMNRIPVDRDIFAD